MTTPPPGPTSGVLSSPRALAALGLVGYVALAEFFGFIDWIADSGTFASRSAEASGLFLDLFTMALPLVAVLIAVKIAPPLGLGRTIVLVALIEYAIAVVLGLITFLVGLGYLFDVGSGLHGTQALLLGLARVVLVAIAGYTVYRMFSDMGGRISVPHATYGGQPQYPGQQPQYPPQQPQYPPPPGPPGPPTYPGAQ